MFQVFAVLIQTCYKHGAFTDSMDQVNIHVKCHAFAIVCQQILKTNFIVLVKACCLATANMY